MQKYIVSLHRGGAEAHCFDHQKPRFAHLSANEDRPGAPLFNEKPPPSREDGGKRNIE